MDWLWWLLGQGALVSLVVDGLKRIPFVARHPKLVAALLNALAVAIQEQLLNTLPAGLVEFLLAVAVAFTTSVGFYQVKKDAGVGSP